MFEAKLKDIGLLRDSVATISDLIDEAEIRITKDGLDLVSSDRAVVVVVNFSLSADVFDEYECDSEQKIGINLQQFLQVLRRAGPEDVLSMNLDKNKLKVKFTNGSTRSFELPLIDVSKNEAPPMDKLEFSTQIRVNTDILGSGIDDADLIADSVVLTVNKNQLVMKGESDSSLSQLDLPSGEFEVVDIGEPVRARYSLDYLKKIIKAKRLAEKAELALSTDYPMKMSFEDPGRVRLSFILAPRVEEV